MKKAVVVILVLVAIGALVFYLMQDSNEVEENGNVKSAGENVEMKVATDDEFAQCLADAGMIIYGSSTCPACQALVNQFGGYDNVAPVYVECNDDVQRCTDEMQTGYVPEVQINGELFSGNRSVEAFAQETGCEL